MKSRRPVRFITRAKRSIIRVLWSDQQRNRNGASALYADPVLYGGTEYCYGRRADQIRLYCKKEAVRRTQELAHKYNFDIDVTRKVSSLTVSEKQKVEILKTLYRNAEVIILDEPTAVLTPQETEALFEQLEKFRETGHTIVFISHKLNEVMQISDRITVIRLGETKGTYDAKDITMDRLTELIIGSKLEDSYDEFKHPVEIRS